MVFAFLWILSPHIALFIGFLFGIKFCLKKISRQYFILNIFIIWSLFALFIKFISGDAGWLLVAPILIPITFGFGFYYGYLISGRALDIGGGRWLAFAGLVPIVTLYLCFPASKGVAVPSDEQKKTPIFLFAGYSYLFASIIVFVIGWQMESPWRYHSKYPSPIEIETPEDKNLSVQEISNILDEIDLAYIRREPTESVQYAWSLETIVRAIFFPASLALDFKRFIMTKGYSEEKKAFTLSVKRRYNHLAQLAVAKGMEKEGFLFQEDAGYWKQNGLPYSCSLEKRAHSSYGDQRAQLRFANRSDGVIKVFWLTYKGERRFYSRLSPGEAYTQLTKITHFWIVTDANDVCLGVYIPSEEFKEVIIR